MRTRKRNNYYIFIGLFLILIGIISIGIKYYNNYQLLKKNDELVNVFFVQENDGESKSFEETSKTNEETYIAILEIPKIKLKRGFYSFESKNNDVNKNIQLIKPSDMPNVKNGNLILASHSGQSKISFFKYLHRLYIGDTANVYYQNKKYVYEVVNIYEDSKNGSIEIIRDYDKNTLTLITCSKTDDSKQVVYILELVDIENY